MGRTNGFGERGLRHCQLVEGSALLPRDIEALDRSQQAHVALLHEDLRVGRFGLPFSSPQEPHYGDEVEGSSQV